MHVKSLKGYLNAKYDFAATIQWAKRQRREFIQMITNLIRSGHILPQSILIQMGSQERHVTHIGFQYLGSRRRLRFTNIVWLGICPTEAGVMHASGENAEIHLIVEFNVTSYRGSHTFTSIIASSRTTVTRVQCLS